MGFIFFKLTFDILINIYYNLVVVDYVPVAQLDRATVF